MQNVILRLQSASSFIKLIFTVGFILSFSLLTQAAQTKNTITSIESSKLKQDGSTFIDIHFDKPFSAKMLKPELNRNFAQYVFKNTGITSAKMVNIGENKIQKIFAYAYNPEVVRIRVILEDQAIHFKDRIFLKNLNSKTIRLVIKSIEKPGISAASVKANPETEKEQKIIGEVIEKTKEIDINNPESVQKSIFAKKAEERTALKEVPKDSSQVITSFEKESDIGVKKDPSRGFVKMALFMFGVISLFTLTIFGLKKYSASFKKLPFGKKERLIQVVATHYLGGKKSLSLVKVAGEFMVIGVANENISLISKMDPQKNIDQMLEDRFWGGTFEKHLSSYASDVSVIKDDRPISSTNSGTENSKENNPKFLYDGIKDLDLAQKVTDKVELSSFRASLKEKIGNLKPLERA